MTERMSITSETTLCARGCIAAAALLVACGGDGPAGSDPPNGTGASGAFGGGAAADGGTGGTADVGPGGSASGGGPAAGGAGGGSAGDLPDPEEAGPYTIAEIDATATVASTGNQVPLHVVYPTAGPTPGPFPTIVIGHGFQIASSQYGAYATHLASFGYVAILADFPASFLSVSHMDNARDMIGALDWAAVSPDLAGIADVSNSGMAGHSLGGKVALLAATLDPRVKAVVALDPVDGSMSCSVAECPDVSNLMPVPIPTAFLGETLDATGSFQACAPAADNYQTFYANTSTPSIEVTVIGANHVSFVNQPASCGLACAFCKPATLDAPTVNAIARSYLAAFFERHLDGLAGYDDYLTGPIAEERYVATGLATISSK